MHLRPCLLRWQVRRSVHIQNKLFPQLGSRDVEFHTNVHNNISVVQLKPTKKYLQCLLVPLAFATAKSALIAEATSSSSVGSQAHPKMLAAVANRWADTEFKVPSSSGMVKANDDGLAFDSRMLKPQLLKVKMKSCGGKPHRAPRSLGRAWVPLIARVPHMGNPHSNKIDRSFAVLMVLGGGGGVLP